MHLPHAVSEALGVLAYEFSKVQPLLPTYSHLVISALFPIYAGAHSSLSRPSSAAKPKKKRSKDGKLIDDEPEQQMEGLSASDAIVFPILAGCMLTALYFIIKWLEDPALLNKILNAYFAFFSVFSVSKIVSDGLDVIHSFLFPHEYVYRGLLYKVKPATKTAEAMNASNADAATTPLPGPFSQLPLPKWMSDLAWYLHVLPAQKFTFKINVHRLIRADVKLGIHGIEGLVAGIAAVAYFNFVDKPWWLTNLMGFGFAYGALQLMSPTTFWTGTLILSALFFYDIYFVFFTPMMVTVAKSLDVPIKLVFPRPNEPDSDVPQLSMLGLGDVVLPGIMIGLALRFDLYMYYLKKQRTGSEAKPTEEIGGPKRENLEDGGEQLALLALEKINHGLTFDDLAPEEKIAFEHKVSKSGTPHDERTEDNLAAAAPAREKSTEPNSQPTPLKAPYLPVHEAWGDRFWTSRAARMLYPRAAVPSLPGYMPLAATGYRARNAFPKPYFHAGLAGYTAGMLATLAAMQVSHHAQPALLYLVPGVVGSLWLAALLRGEVALMWAFSDAGEEEVVDKSGKEEKKGDKDVHDGESKEAKKGTAEEKNKKKPRGLFSASVSDERDERLKRWVDKHAEHKASAEQDSSSSSAGEAGSGKKKSNARSHRGKKLFEFSIIAPKPYWEEGGGDATDKEKQKWTRSDSTGQEAREEHAGKRLRLR